MRRPLRFVLIVAISLPVHYGALHVSEYLDLPAVPAAAAVVHAQAPPPAAPRDCSPNGTVQFVCGLRAPEDLVALPGSQWIVASAFSGDGGLFLIRVSDKTVTQVYPSASTAERLDAKTYELIGGVYARVP